MDSFFPRLQNGGDDAYFLSSLYLDGNVYGVCRTEAHREQAFNMRAAVRTCLPAYCQVCGRCWKQGEKTH